MSEQYTVPTQGEFFEKLRKRAMKKAKELRIPASLDTLQAIQATIEALKEMMVGEPMIATISHNKLIMGDIGDEEYLFTNLHVAGHHGTDGEEVTAMVFRDAS